MIAGFVCPKCNKPTAKDVRNSKGGENIVGRYRVCTCGRSVRTVEIPYAEHQQLIAFRNSLEPKNAR